MARRVDRMTRRKRRQFKIRKKVSGVAERPRLSVFRSARHIYVQAIDDEGGRTLTSASTHEKEFRKKLKSYPGNRESAALVGKELAQRLAKLGVDKAVFDRGGNRFQGRVKALAEGAREGGIQF